MSIFLISRPTRYCFPFGRPEGALKATLSLLERVLMKDIVTPVPPEEVRSTIKKSLENAALDNYTRLSAEAKIEGENAQSAQSQGRIMTLENFSFTCRGSSWRDDGGASQETRRSDPFGRAVC